MSARDKRPEIQRYLKRAAQALEVSRQLLANSHLPDAISFALIAGTRYLGQGNGEDTVIIHA